MIRSALAPLALLLTLLLSAAPAGAAGPINRGDCINRTPSARFSSLDVAGTGLTLMYRSGRRAQARRVAARLRAGRVWPTFRDGFRLGAGRAVLPIAAPYRRARIYLVAHSQLGSTDEDAFDGTTLPFCGAPDSAGMLAEEHGDTADAALIAAHELFHAFQAGVTGRIERDTWFAEATAEWGNATTVGTHLGADRSLYAHPEARLGLFDGDHEYAAFRVVQWLREQYSAPQFWQLLVRVFEADARDPGARSTAPLASALRRIGGSLDDQLARFWDRAAADAGGAMPFGGPPRFEELPAGTTRSWDQDPEGARLLRLTAPAGARWVRIAITATGGGHLYVRDGQTGERPAAYDRTFCVGGGAPAWPGVFTAAYVATGESHLTATFASGTDDGPCPPPVPAATPEPVPTPVPAAAGCVAQRGVYDTTAEPIITDQRIYLDVLCSGTIAWVNGVGGTIACPGNSGTLIPISPAGAEVHVTGGDLPADGRLSVSYTYQGRTVSIDLTVVGSVASGHATVSGAPCGTGSWDFTAPWRHT